MSKLKWKVYLLTTLGLWGFLGIYVGTHLYPDLLLSTLVALIAWSVLHLSNLGIWAMLDAVYLERGKRVDAIKAEAIRTLWDSDLHSYKQLSRKRVRDTIDHSLGDLLDGKIKRRKS